MYIWYEPVYGNPVWAWLLALGLALLALVGLRIARGVVYRRLHAYAQTTTSDLDNLAADLLARTNLLFLFLALSAGSLVVVLPEKVTTLLSSTAVIALLVQAGIWGNGVVAWWLTRYVRQKVAENPSLATTLVAMGYIVRLAIWSLILLLALSNMGIEIDALIAGLGVGGIAVALAVQNILGDLFASLSIVLDRPFEVGDFIIVGEFLGTVENIGLKTTRVRSLSGEQIVFANNDLLQSRIRNYKRMSERRVLFTFGVIYQTSHGQLAAIPGMVQEIIEAQPQTRFDRAHFKDYGDSSLNFEIVYYMLQPDYNLYMDTQQAINLELFRRFADAGIEFAYPTRTLYVRQE